MAEYKYVKSVVNLDRLVLEIEENQDITKVCKYGFWDRSNNVLTLNFIEALNSSEESVLNGIVLIHKGDPPNKSNLYCPACDKVFEEVQYLTVLKCPQCKSQKVTGSKEVVIRTEFVLLREKSGKKFMLTTDLSGVLTTTEV